MTLEPHPFDMGIEVRPIALPGCFSVVAGLITLGVAPLVIWLAERRWLSDMNADGFTTRAGKRYRWREVRAIRQVSTWVDHVRTERWDLETDQGAVAHIVVHRLHQGEQVLAYARRMLRAL